MIRLQYLYGNENWCQANKDEKKNKQYSQISPKQKNVLQLSWEQLHMNMNMNWLIYFSYRDLSSNNVSLLLDGVFAKLTNLEYL